MQLTADEMITFSVSPRFELIWPQCACGQDAYRIVGVFDRGLRKEIPLCAGHFIEACVNYPLLSYVEGGSGLGFHNLKSRHNHLSFPQTQVRTTKFQPVSSHEET